MGLYSSLRWFEDWFFVRMSHRSPQQHKVPNPLQDLEQTYSTTKEGWAVERLSLELRTPIFPTYLTHSFKRGRKKLQVSFLKVSPPQRGAEQTRLQTEKPTFCR